MANQVLFLQTLNSLLGDPLLTTKNAFLTPAILADLQAKIGALTPDVLSWYAAADVVTTGITDLPTGGLAPNVLKNRIELDTDGFQFTFSKFRDGLQPTPRKIRRRHPGDQLFTTPADRVRYVMADTTAGVLLLDQNMEIVRTFPGLIPAITIPGAALAQYNNAEAACVATVGSTELIFIACGIQHCVKILDYVTGTHMATIGVPGTAGLPTASPVKLTDPVSVTVDPVNSRLWVACRTGDPGTDITGAGFVAEFDILIPSSPTFVGYVVQGNGFYRLNNGECRRPSDVFFQPATLTPSNPDRLWISNGLGDVAGFTKTLSTNQWIPFLVLEAQGQDYTIGPDTVATPDMDFAENAIDLLTDALGNTRLYVAASLTAQVEVFRASSIDTTMYLGEHEATYGHRGIEDTMPYGTPLRVYSTPQQPPLTYGVFTQATGVVADSTLIPGETVASPVIVVSDAQAGRVQRLRLGVFANSNTVTFTPQTSVVPTSIGGWFLPADADIPPEYITFEVRDPGAAAVGTTPAIPASLWREVPLAGLSTPVTGAPLTRYQFRLRVQLPTDAPVKAYSIPAVGVILRQNW